MIKNKDVITRGELTFKSQNAVFIDRDGVIIKDMHYINDDKDVMLEEGAKEFLQQCSLDSIPVFIVTNQSGIERGYSSWESYKAVTNRMLELLDHPSCIKAIYANSFTTNSEFLNNNEWRKPQPGMILEAKKYWQINIDNSIIVGDRLTDIIAGARAGIKRAYHVLTGHGSKSRAEVLQSSKLTWRDIYQSDMPDIKYIKSLECINQEMVSGNLWSIK